MRHLLFILFGTFLTIISCTNQTDQDVSSNLVEASNYSQLTLDQFETIELDSDLAYSYYNEIQNLKANAKGDLLESDLLSIGNPADDIELFYAVLVNENIEPEFVISKEKSEEIEIETSNDVEVRFNTRYRWDGVNHYYSFWWRTNMYYCDMLDNFTGTGCTGYGYGKRWRSCFKVDCNKPSCWF